MMQIIVTLLYDAFVVLMLANAVISWVPQWRWTTAGRIIFSITEPMLTPFRRMLQPIAASRGVRLDLSPLLLLLVAWILYQILLKLV